MVQSITRTMQIRRAESARDQLQVRQLIEQVYRSRYGVSFSEEVDPDRKQEPYPDHYVLGAVDGEVVAAAGLYTRFTYAQRFGQLTEADLLEVLTAAGCPEALSRARVEYTKLVVRPGWEGKGLGRTFLAATHCQDFLGLGLEEPPLLLSAGKVSVFEHLYRPMGLHTRRVKPFPHYQSHARYCSPEDPMETRLTLPELDIDRRWYEFRLPGEVEVGVPETALRERASGA